MLKREVDDTMPTFPTAGGRILVKAFAVLNFQMSTIVVAAMPDQSRPDQCPRSLY